MEEQLISFETAVLAKEKGFDIKTLYRFLGETYREVDLNCQLWDNEYYAPTQSLLQKWLREVHGIHVQPYFYPNTISTREIKPEVEIIRVFAKDGITKSILPPSLRNEEFDTYEQAFEEGLLAALKLIK
jgi:hypothetical protein